MTADSRSPSTPSAGKLVFLALGLVVGASSGAAVAWVVQTRARNAYESRMAVQRDEERSGLAHPDPSAGGTELDRSDRVDATSRAETKPGGTADTDVYGDVQRAYGRVGIERGWALERKDTITTEEMNVGLAQYEELVRASPDKIGRELAQRRTKSEEAERDAKSGGVLTLLDKLAEGGAGLVLDSVRDPKRFGEFFPRQTGESVVDGTSSREHPDKQVEDGVTLTFPAGVFSFRGLMRERDPFPSDVTLAGAGMDATLLVLQESFFTRGPLVRFAIRDCTVLMENGPLVDLRLKPGSLLFDRVRFVGFDIGAGGSEVFGAVEHGLALRASDCRFEGGYGRAPWSGRLLDVRNDALIARFDRCRFDEMRMDVWRFTAGVTVVFSACTMTDLLDNRPVTEQAATKPGVEFEGCSYTYFGGDSNAAPEKDLNMLFPNWRERMQ